MTNAGNFAEFIGINPFSGTQMWAYKAGDVIPMKMLLNKLTEKALDRKGGR